MSLASRLRLSLKDPVSGLTHLLGALLAALSLVVLMSAGLRHGSLRHVVAYSVFGVSLILLYGASSLYHLLPKCSEPGSLLHRLDHMMIYVLIAGTYTPLCLITLDERWGTPLLAFIWLLAAAGMVFKLLAKRLNHWASTASYVAMGWTVVVVGPLLLERLSSGGLGWLVAGGLFYTLGALIYALRKPNPFPPWVGSHELFHLLVMAGSASHFWATLQHVR